jgi:hypothetical protein
VGLRRKKLGVSPAQYDAMVAAQGGVCAICGRPDVTGRDLALDHDHKTLRVRGLLCGNCNHALGKLRDDPVLLRKAADYVEKYR